jgi:hypothetical protein
LGRWLHSSSKLRREWPFHYQASTDTLYVTTEDGYIPSVPHPYFRGAYSTEQVTQKEEFLPDDCFPVFGTRYTTGVWVSSSDRQDACGVTPVTPAPDVSTFEDYIAVLPEWE